MSALGTGLKMFLEVSVSGENASLLLGTKDLQGFANRPVVLRIKLTEGKGQNGNTTHNDS